VSGDGIEHHRFQFADIAGKPVGREERAQLGRRARTPLAQLFRRFAEEVLHEERDIFGTFPEGWDHDPVGADPVIEVAAESATGNILAQITVGGGDDPGGTLFRDIGADGVVFLFLEEAQELDLGRFGQVADFVQEEGAVCRGFDQPSARLFRSGVGSFAVAEKGVGEKVVVQAGHVYRNELPRKPAHRMYRPGDKFLAGAGFTGNQHGLAGASDHLAVLEHGLHLIAGRYNGLEGCWLLDPVVEEVFFEHGHLAIQGEDFQGFRDTGNEACVFNRLEQVIEGAHFHAVDSRFQVIRGSHDDDRDLGIVPAEFGQDVLAGNVGHEQVQDDGAHLFFGQEGQHLPAVGNGCHVADGCAAQQRGR